jgi:hypothetical protein
MATSSGLPPGALLDDDDDSVIALDRTATATPDPWGKLLSATSLPLPLPAPSPRSTAEDDRVVTSASATALGGGNLSRSSSWGGPASGSSYGGWVGGGPSGEGGGGGGGSEGRPESAASHSSSSTVEWPASPRASESAVTITVGSASGSRPSSRSSAAPPQAASSSASSSSSSSARPRPQPGAVDPASSSLPPLLPLASLPGCYSRPGGLASSGARTGGGVDAASSLVSAAPVVRLGTSPVPSVSCGPLSADDARSALSFLLQPLPITDPGFAVTRCVVTVSEGPPHSPTSGTGPTFTLWFAPRRDNAGGLVRLLLARRTAASSTSSSSAPCYVFSLLEEGFLTMGGTGGGGGPPSSPPLPTHPGLLVARLRGTRAGTAYSLFDASAALGGAGKGSSSSSSAVVRELVPSLPSPAGPRVQSLPALLLLQQQQAKAATRHRVTRRRRGSLIGLSAANLAEGLSKLVALALGRDEGAPDGSDADATLHGNEEDRGLPPAGLPGTPAGGKGAPHGGSGAGAGAGGSGGGGGGGGGGGVLLSSVAPAPPTRPRLQLAHISLEREIAWGIPSSALQKLGVGAGGGGVGVGGGGGGAPSPSSSSASSGKGHGVGHTSAAGAASSSSSSTSRAFAAALWSAFFSGPSAGPIAVAVPAVRVSDAAASDGAVGGGTGGQNEEAARRQQHFAAAATSGGGRGAAHGPSAASRVSIAVPSASLGTWPWRAAPASDGVGWWDSGLPRQLADWRRDPPTVAFRSTGTLLVLAAPAPLPSGWSAEGAAAPPGRSPLVPPPPSLAAFGKSSSAKILRAGDAGESSGGSSSARRGGPPPLAPLGRGGPPPGAGAGMPQPLSPSPSPSPPLFSLKDVTASGPPPVTFSHAPGAALADMDAILTVRGAVAVGAGGSGGIDVPAAAAETGGAAGTAAPYPSPLLSSSTPSSGGVVGVELFVRHPLSLVQAFAVVVARADAAWRGGGGTRE